MFDMISIFLGLPRLLLFPNTWSILENSPCALEKIIYSAVLGWNVLNISIKSIWSNVSFKVTVALLIFCLEELSIVVNGMNLSEGMSSINQQTTCVEKDVKKMEPLCPVGGNAVSATVKNSMGFPQKIKNRTAYDPVISLLEICLKGPKTLIWKNMHPYIHCSIIYNSQDLESAQLPISRWMYTKVVVHIHRRIYSAVKKKDILPSAIAW